MEESKKNEGLTGPARRYWPESHRTNNQREAEAYSRNGSSQADEMMLNSLIQMEKSLKNLTEKLEKLSKVHMRNDGSRDVKQEIDRISEASFTLRKQLEVSRQAFTSTKFPGRLQREVLEDD